LARKSNTTDSPFVFPGTGKTGHLVESKHQTAQVSKESGIKFCLHDLRRVFINTAESLDISSYAVKQLVNHSIGGDVTAGYMVSDPERLRKPMERIETHLLRDYAAKIRQKLFQYKIKVSQWKKKKYL
jgi:hypothetical protein